MREHIQRFTPLAAAALCLFVAGAGRAEEARGLDREFLTRAFQDGLFEVEVGKQATAQADSHWVQEFGDRMVKEHAATNRQLLTLLKQKDVRVSGKLDKNNRERLRKLAKVRGTEFDRAYMKQMVEDHKKAVALFEKEVKKGEDPDLKAFAVQTLPVLKEHLELARQTLNKVEGKKGR